MRRLRHNPRDVLRRHRGKAIGLTLLGTIIILSIPLARVVAINPTESLPRGLYVKSSAPLAVGAIVEFHTPDVVRSHVDGGFEYLLKPVVAGPGDRVDTTTGRVIVNGTAIADSNLLSTDSQGRPVPSWCDSRVLGPDEFFVLSTRIPNSVDSRYFGPIRRADVVSVRRCVWAWE